MTGKVSESYYVRPADMQKERDTVLRLWRHISSDNPPQPEKLDWFYTRNPAGSGTIYLLIYRPDEQPVGIICAGQREFLVEGKTYNGVVIGDFVIAPTHRSLGPGLLFQREYVKQALDRYDFLFGFPNPLSAQLWKFGGNEIGANLKIFVLPLRMDHYLKKHMPNVIAKPIGGMLTSVYNVLLRNRIRDASNGYNKADTDAKFVDSLWQRANKIGCAIGIRNWKYFDWRANNDPTKSYQFVGIADQDNQPAGFLVSKSDVGGKECIVDYLALNDEAFAALLAIFTGDHITKRTPSVSVAAQDHDKKKLAAISNLGFKQREEDPYLIRFRDEASKTLTEKSMVLNILDKDT